MASVILGKKTVRCTITYL